MVVRSRCDSRLPRSSARRGCQTSVSWTPSGPRRRRPAAVATPQRQTGLPSRSARVGTFRSRRRAPLARGSITRPCEKRPARRRPRPPRASVGYSAPLGLVEPAPDAVWLADTQGVVQALPANRASRAHGLGLPLPGDSCLFTLEVGGGKEDGCRLPAARRLYLPVLRCIQCRSHSQYLWFEGTPAQAVWQ